MIAHIRAAVNDIAPTTYASLVASLHCAHPQLSPWEASRNPRPVQNWPHLRGCSSMDIITPLTAQINTISCARREPRIFANPGVRRNDDVRRNDGDRCRGTKLRTKKIRVFFFLHDEEMRFSRAFADCACPPGLHPSCPSSLTFVHQLCRMRARGSLACVSPEFLSSRTCVYREPDVTATAINVGSTILNSPDILANVL